MTQTASQPQLGRKVLLIAYLIHLLIPLSFLLDISLEGRFTPQSNDLASPPVWWVDFGTTGQVVFLVSSIWIILGLLVFAALLFFKILPGNRLLGPLISVYAAILVLFLVELGMNVLPGNETKPALWPQGR